MMERTANSNRKHIALFGRRNAGKSSLFNLILEQNISLVSDFLGTTTDPVYKAMELVGYGPIRLVDTAGLDDIGELGKLRVQKSREVLQKIDMAIYILDASQKIDEKEIKEAKVLFQRFRIPHVFVWNKIDLLEEKEKTAKETASRLFNYLSNLWSYAVLKDYCEYNYLANINKNDVLVEKRRKNNYEKITDEVIFKELVNKIYNYNGSISIKNALKFVLHIPLRAYNLCFLKWSYIDFEKKILTIPRSEMKVKNHNLTDFQLPLTSEVIKILNDQKAYWNDPKKVDKN